MPMDSQGYINEWKGKQLDGTQSSVQSLHPELNMNMSISLAIVESVRDGTTLRVRLFMPDGEHQFVNITLAGARSPRTASRQGETSEPLGEEVRRLILRHVPPAH
jgi:staphylococcal nuclease domain-containing protein 1